MADMIIGFRMIRRDDSGISIITCDTGEVDYEPKQKYRIEKKNAFDPSLIKRRDLYREDSFSIEAYLLPAEYNAMLYFLTQEGDFFLEYEQEGHSHQMQFPVTIESLPKCTDDLHSEPDKIKFTAISRYTGTLPFIDFNSWVEITEETLSLT
ncbi:MAG TPA: hypothetical protein PLE74_05600 [Candidatus Cloacimonadota bacterium]|nr:hypothetical protein [Candidatus Cloacimonadota bacterium]